jgi:GT2 family glycosyltransferase
MKDVPGEVVIVDGSGDHSVECPLRRWASTAGLPFELAFVRCPPGLTRQRNAGIDASTDPYVFFLDDDTVPLDHYFCRIRDVFRDDTSGRVGVVAGLIENEVDKPISLRWRLRFALCLAPEVEPMHYHASCTSTPAALVKPFSGTKRVDIVPGGASCFRREVFAQHRFSEFFHGYSQGEDLEMSLRAGRDWELRWCGDARLLHLHVKTGRVGGFRKGRMEVVNRYFIRNRHSPDALLRHRIRFWLDIVFIACIDLLSFGRYPTQIVFLSHAAGVAIGAAECLVRPPRFKERASAAYRVNWSISE